MLTTSARTTALTYRRIVVLSASLGMFFTPEPILADGRSSSLGVKRFRQLFKEIRRTLRLTKCGQNQIHVTATSGTAKHACIAEPRACEKTKLNRTERTSSVLAFLERSRWLVSRGSLFRRTAGSNHQLNESTGPGMAVSVP